MARLKLKVGSRVRTQYSGSTGRVARVDPTKKRNPYYVEWDEGSKSWERESFLLGGTANRRKAGTRYSRSSSRSVRAKGRRAGECSICQGPHKYKHGKG